MRRPQRPGWGERPPDRLEQRIAVERDGTITARSGKVEYGQGIRTGFAHIVAEELNLPAAWVRVELGETARVPWDMGTFGSMSTAIDGVNLRKAAVFARQQLVARARDLLNTGANDMAVEDGRVIAPDGRSLSFVELTAGEPLTGEVPDEVAGSAQGSPADYRPERTEGLAIVTGTARYPADVRLPGMLYGHVLRPARHGSVLQALETSAAEAMPGVVAVVREGDFVGVVAERNEQAMAAVEAIRATWISSTPAETEPMELALRQDDGVDAVFAGAAKRIGARYHVPHIGHAPLGLSAAVADVHRDRAELYAATQRPFGLRDDVAELFGLKPDRVEVHPQMMGGMFGRGNMNDASIETARLSRAVKRPVLVQWTREEEFQSGPDRPTLDADVEAALSKDGMVVGWRYSGRTNPHSYGWGSGSPQVAEMTAGRNMIPPYALGPMQALLSVEPGVIRTGSFRSLGAALHVFAIESFLDELARAVGVDAIAFRLKHTVDPRLVRVLEMVREISGWGKPAAGRHGRGVACTIYHGTYVAEVVEVSIDDDGHICLERVWCAVDAGRLVHPDAARNQIEGGVQQAASWTLFEELQVQEGQVTTATWRDYPIARFTDAPRTIEVTFTGDVDAPSTGIGEPGSVPTAAAIANAVFDATGVRHRRLPLDPRPATHAAG
jgi:nicotinate dehydrogenase subunit B